MLSPLGGSDHGLESACVSFPSLPRPREVGSLNRAKVVISNNLRKQLELWSHTPLGRKRGWGVDVVVK